MKDQRVIYISYNGATEPVSQSQVIPYLKALARKGYSFDLVTFEKKDTVFSDKETIRALDKDLIAHNIKLHRLRYHKYPSLLATAFDMCVGIFYILCLALKSRYSLLHARQIVPAVMCLVVGGLLNIKWIFDMRGLVAEEYVGHGAWREHGIKFKLVKWFEKMCIINASHIVVLTNRHKDFLLSLPFVNRDKIMASCIPCCVDMNRFNMLTIDERKRIREELAMGDEFTLLYLGSLGTCYFLNKMLLFFKKLKEIDSQAIFLFLTSYEQNGIFESAMKAGVATDSIKVKFVHPALVHRWVGVADAGIYFINPYKKLGSCPIKLGEFLSAGIPVVINRGIGDSGELVEDNKVGVVVDNFDDDHYAIAFNGLLQLSDSKESLRVRCRATAEEYLSLEGGVKEYLKIYASVGKKK